MQMAEQSHQGEVVSRDGGIRHAARDRHAPALAERRHAAARSALAEMQRQGLIADLDDELLDLLAAEISEPVIREMVRFWRASKVDAPTPLSLLTLAEVLHLRVAVADLDS
jgi:hypothetical protein